MCGSPISSNDATLKSDGQVYRKLLSCQRKKTRNSQPSHSPPIIDQPIRTSEAKNNLFSRAQQPPMQLARRETYLRKLSKRCSCTPKNRQTSRPGTLGITEVHSLQRSGNRGPIRRNRRYHPGQRPHQNQPWNNPWLPRRIETEPIDSDPRRRHRPRIAQRAQGMPDKPSYHPTHHCYQQRF